MKTILFLFISIFTIEASHSQLFLEENFNYTDYAAFKTANNYEQGEVCWDNCAGQNCQSCAKWLYKHTGYWDFNNNGIQETWEYIKNTSIANIGIDDNKSIKFEYYRMDPSHFNEFVESGENYNHLARNEIATWADPNRTEFIPGEEYWVEYSVYIPGATDFPFEILNSPLQGNYCNENFDIIGQWHLHDAMSRPPVNLQIRGNKWFLVLNPNDVADGGSTNDTNLCGPGSTTYMISNVVRNQWVTWKFNIVFSSDPDIGKVKLWKNDIPVLTSQLAGNFKTIWYDKELYFKIGDYKPHWWARNTDTDKRIFYVDKVKSYRKNLIEEECGTKVLSANDMTITTGTVRGAQDYHFRIGVPDQIEDIHIHSPSPTVDLSNYSWIKPNREYIVKTKIDNHRPYDEYAEPACEFYTEELSLGLIDDDCGVTVSDMTLTTKSIPGNHNYHFRFDSPAQNGMPAINNNHIYSYDPTINLTNYSWIHPNRYYYVNTKIDNHPIFYEYSSTSCKVTIPNFIKEKGELFENGFIDDRTAPILYPNPISGNKINFKLLGDEKLIDAWLYSLDGRTVPLKISDDIILLNDNLTKGLYSLKLRTNKFEYFFKVLK